MNIWFRTVNVTEDIGILITESKLLNYMTATTNLTIPPAWETLIPQSTFSVAINGIQQVSPKVMISKNTQGLLVLDIEIKQSIPPSDVVEINITNSLFRSTYGYRVKLRTSVSNPTLITYFNDREISMIENLDASSKTLGKAVTKSLGIWSMLGVNFLISSLLGFFNLSLMYVFLPIRSLVTPIREILYSLFQMFDSQTDTYSVMTLLMNINSS